MPLSRPQPKIAVVVAVVVAVVLALLLPSAALAQPVASSTITADGVGDAMLGSSPQELADALVPTTTLATKSVSPWTLTAE